MGCLPDSEHGIQLIDQCSIIEIIITAEL